MHGALLRQCLFFSFSFVLPFLTTPGIYRKRATVSAISNITCTNLCFLIKHKIGAPPPPKECTEGSHIQSTRVVISNSLALEFSTCVCMSMFRSFDAGCLYGEAHVITFTI